MASRDVSRLQEDFPDLTQSTLNDVLTTYKDPRKAKEALQSINDELRRENNRKIEELKQVFPGLPEHAIKEVLEANDWNVDSAIVPLFNKSEEISNKAKELKGQESRKKREQEERRRGEEAKLKARNNLLEIFHTIPKEKVQQLLDENEGDIEETTNQLLSLVAEQDEEKEKHKKRAEEAAKQRIVEEQRLEKEQERKLQELKIQALCEKFEDLSEQQVVRALESTKWDLKLALQELFALSANQKKDRLLLVFPTLTEADIISALQATNWNSLEATQLLQEKKRKEELKEQRRRERREQKRKEREERDRKRMEEKEKQKEEELRQILKHKKSEEEKDDDDEEQNGDQPASGIVQVAKVTPQNFLERSVLLGQKLEDEIAASQIMLKRQEEEQKQAAKVMFKEDLEHIIATQARHGVCPGMAPPLPKQIDVMLNKKPAPIEDSNSDIENSQQNIPPPVRVDDTKPQDLSNNNNNSKCSLTLRATPSDPDVTNPITLEWEVQSGSSTSYDWIGLFPVNQPNKQYYTYQWRGKDEKKGTLTFYAPKIYGEYEFRYFPGNSYEHVAMSNRIKVGPKIVLQANHDKVNGKFLVRWNQQTGNVYSRAWIGLYEKTQTNNKLYLSWEYAAKPDAEMAFTAPVKPQEYEFRFFTNSYEDVARGPTIRVEGEDRLTGSLNNGYVTLTGVNIVSVDPATEGVWLGLYFTKEGDNRQWRRYKYVTSRNADIQFKAPRTGGEYEARVFANGSYTPIVRSNKFNIPDTK